MGNQYSLIFPPAAKFTEKDCPDQTGKVFIVTGGASGIGLELVHILYSHNAKVYIAARSAEKANKAIESIKSQFPKSSGAMLYLHLDLNDLTTIKASANEFLAKETKLQVLWNNAGVMVPPQGSTTAQGYELQLGTNNIAPFLFTKFLTPLLIATAKSEPTASVRVVWLSSSVAEAASPKGGVDMSNLDYKKDKMAWEKYGVSKAGNILQAKEFARRYGPEGVISVSLNPGNLKTALQRHMPKWQLWILNLMLHEPINGAYTELFAGLSPEVTPEKNGAWIQPWGRFMPLRKDIEEGCKPGGNADKFWEWNEEQVEKYL